MGHVHQGENRRSVSIRGDSNWHGQRKQEAIQYNFAALADYYRFLVDQGIKRLQEKGIVPDGKQSNGVGNQTGAAASHAAAANRGSRSRKR